MHVPSRGTLGPRHSIRPSNFPEPLKLREASVPASTPAEPYDSRRGPFAPPRTPVRAAPSPAEVPRGLPRCPRASVGTREAPSSPSEPPTTAVDASSTAENKPPGRTTQGSLAQIEPRPRVEVQFYLAQGA
ncbi:hypothetical protein THAOC_35596 [Thalassiosira oceanica]|uniref:Uncharacterized protein n=1 Tax=Thalassiosira oceanica TaxID=159749 RepID=K0RGU5_THAOC|nr:hypothetical protein THAOC_35596 [Thalassiosira oceanica]|eukprot:EJK45772.1 hypothetical protein THAOC_35596 [Thalassiosira oceanica]